MTEIDILKSVVQTIRPEIDELKEQLADLEAQKLEAETKLSELNASDVKWSVTLSDDRAEQKRLIGKLSHYINECKNQMNKVRQQNSSKFQLEVSKVTSNLAGGTVLTFEDETLKKACTDFVDAVSEIYNSKRETADEIQAYINTLAKDEIVNQLSLAGTQITINNNFRVYINKSLKNSSISNLIM